MHNYQIGKIIFSVDKKGGALLIRFNENVDISLVKHLADLSCSDFYHDVKNRRVVVPFLGEIEEALFLIEKLK